MSGMDKYISQAEMWFNCQLSFRIIKLNEVIKIKAIND